MYGATGRLSFKWSRNENNTNILLYQIYLWKLHENILKYYRLNLFKEFAIGFNHGFHTTQESPTHLSDGFLI